MSSVGTYFKWNNAKISTLSRKTQQGLVMMAYEVANQAKQNAPYDEGTLRNSIRVVPNTNGVEVIAGGSYGGKKIAYAKRREYENNKNPHTKFYMKNALETVLESNWKENFFGGITK